MAKKILIFSFAYHPVIGGAEVAVKEITDRMPDIEWDMVTQRFDKKHKQEEKIGNVNVHRIDSSKTLFPLEAFFYARKLHEERKYDAIWAIMAARAGAAALFFKMSFRDVPYILNLQEGDPVWYMKLRSLYYINPLFRKIFSQADTVQAISHYLADYAHTMGYEGKVEVIPNGIDLEKFQMPALHTKTDKTNTTLITTSRLVGKNGVRDIISALPLLSSNVRLDIVGDGPLKARLKEDARRLGVEDRVRFLGHVENEKLLTYLHQADIFVRPSLSEGLGISFLEAMAAGLPVIATPVGGIVDFLEDGKTGLFCEPKNSESIAQAVKKLMDDGELRERIISNSRKMVEEKYNWDLIAEEMRSKVFEL